LAASARCAAGGEGGPNDSVIPIPPGVRVLVATRPVDFRKGADSLAALARETLAQDPFCGAVLVFRSRRADRLKILVWDGSGLVLVWKRLEQGAFRWPPITEGVMRLSPGRLGRSLRPWSKGSIGRACMCHGSGGRRRRDEGCGKLIHPR
jgi:transposase